MLKNIDIWLSSHITNKIKNSSFSITENKRPKKILFTICDHFEPFWNKASETVAYNRVKEWAERYQDIASNFKDNSGNHPKHCFYYPEEEYSKNLLDMIKEICQNGFGETEIHLHHDNDTSDNLRRTLVDFKKRLHEHHGLLAIDKITSDIKYGFIHGNWALDNSRPDGKWCGVNDEITVLKETGCYADFTMPSAPSDTQTKIINSIYYAIDDPQKPKSHNSGVIAAAGKQFDDGLLCIQGPLCFNFYNRKFGILPRIENSNLDADTGFSRERIKLWVDQGIHVKGRRDIIFIKLYTHGTIERNMRFLFDDGNLETLFSSLQDYCFKNNHFELCFVSSRQMYNVIKGLELHPDGSLDSLLEQELILKY